MLSDTITIGSKTFSRISPGKWVDDASMVTAPYNLEVKNSIDTSGAKASRYTIQFSQLVDITGTSQGTGMGVLTPIEERRSVYVVFTGSVRHTRLTEYTPLWDDLKAFAAQTGVLNRILRGET